MILKKTYSWSKNRKLILLDTQNLQLFIFTRMMINRSFLSKFKFFSFTNLWISQILHFIVEIYQNKTLRP